MKYTLTLGLTALVTCTAFAAFNAPLPEFKNEKELAQWRAENASKPLSSSATEEPAFFTGRPYLESSSSYAFKYRNYNPEIARWTSEDPSGFPDGANGSAYAPVPTVEFDFQGLETQPAHRDIQANVAGIDIMGEWDGDFVWSFAERQEMSKITPDNPSDGFTGFNGIPLTVNVGGVQLGVGFSVIAIYNNKSSFNTQMINGVQWRQYSVDLEIKFKKILTIGVTVDSEWLTPVTFKKLGHWYE